MTDAAEKVVPVRRPLTADHLRTRAATQLAATPAIGRLATRLPEMVGRIFGHPDSAALRVTVDHVQDETLALPQEGGRWFRLQGASGPLRVLLMLDRPAVFALCEASLGGSGTEPPHADPERPLSRIERGLRDAWLSRCVSGLAELLAGILGGPMTVADEGADGLGIDDIASLDTTLLRLLVNLFGYSGELVIALDRVQLASLLATAGGGSPEVARQPGRRQALQHGLGHAPAPVTVALPAETMSVEDIADLRPGQLLRLAARLSDPVIVSVSGQDIFSGLLDPAGGRLAVRLLAPLP